MNKQLSMTEIAPLISEVISSGGVFRLYPRGTSMLPLIRQGEDSVLLSAPNDILVHDIVLYRRSNGQYVMHRIMKEDKDSYTMCGDNQFVFEPGISRDQIIAKVTGIFRGETLLDLNDEEYHDYVKQKVQSIGNIRIKHKAKDVLRPYWRFFFGKRKQ